MTYFLESSDMHEFSSVYWKVLEAHYSSKLAENGMEMIKLL